MTKSEMPSASARLLAMHQCQLHNQIFPSRPSLLAEAPETAVSKMGDIEDRCADKGIPEASKAGVAEADAEVGKSPGTAGYVWGCTERSIIADQGGCEIIKRLPKAVRTAVW